jgi:Sel1 repeat
MSPLSVKFWHLGRGTVLRTLVAICLAAGMIVTAKAETFVKGLSAFNSGDYAAAYLIWLPLAEQGDANSQSSLAYLFHEGKGVRQDSRSAAKWYYRAALQGEPTAQSFLCQMHLKGDGLPPDLVLALMWCELSIDGGERWASATRDRVMSKLTTADRDRAWALVTRWRAEHPGGTAGTAAADQRAPVGGFDQARAR